MCAAHNYPSMRLGAVLLASLAGMACAEWKLPVELTADSQWLGGVKVYDRTGFFIAVRAYFY